MRKALMIAAVFLAAVLLGGCPGVPVDGTTPATASVSGGELILTDTAGNSANFYVIVNALGGTIHSSVAISGCSDAAAYPGYAHNYTCAGVTDKVTVWAQDGDDTVQATGGTKVEVHGGDGRDTITATFTSSTGNSTVYGDDGNDTIVLKQNAGQVYGGLGDDTITTGPGVDDVHAGPGADTVTAHFGGDTIRGDEDADTLTVGTVAGAACSASPANVPHLRGGPGNDTLNGGDMNDTLDGEAGDDVLHGGQCADSMSGGTGQDHIFALDYGPESLIDCGGTGADSAVLQLDAVDTYTNC